MIWENAIRSHINVYIPLKKSDHVMHLVLQVPQAVQLTKERSCAHPIRKTSVVIQQSLFSKSVN